LRRVRTELGAEREQHCAKRNGNGSQAGSEGAAAHVARKAGGGVGSGAREERRQGANQKQRGACKLRGRRQQGHHRRLIHIAERWMAAADDEI